jgi:hypothetical protein
MSENANQTTPRSGTDNGNSGHYEQGGRRNNPSGNRNNRRRRPSQPYGGQAPGASSQREPIHFGPSGQPGGPSARPQNSGNRPDPYLQNRNVQHDQRQNQGSAVHPSGQHPGNSHQHAAPGPSQGRPPYVNRPGERIDANGVRQTTVRPDMQTPPRKPNNQIPAEYQERPREARTWGRNVRSEETYEDVRKENERLEKEIWLEIASIHTAKLD